MVMVMGGIVHTGIDGIEGSYILELSKYPCTFKCPCSCLFPLSLSSALLLFSLSLSSPHLQLRTHSLLHCCWWCQFYMNIKECLSLIAGRWVDALSRAGQDISRTSTLHSPPYVIRCGSLHPGRCHEFTLTGPLEFECSSHILTLCPISY